MMKPSRVDHGQRTTTGIRRLTSVELSRAAGGVEYYMYLCNLSKDNNNLAGIARWC